MDRFKVPGIWEGEAKEALGEPATLTQLLSDALFHVRQTLGEIVLPVDDGEQLHEELCSGCVEVKGASDSSVKDRTASHAWVVEATEDKVKVEEAGLVVGDPETMDSFHGKLIGVLALIYSLRVLLDFYGDPEEEVDVDLHCNNKSVIEEAASKISARGLKSDLKAEYEVAAEIQG